MNLLDLAKGKTVSVLTDAKVHVNLTVQSVEEVPCSKDLAPATRENDWWPPQETWTEYRVTFTNGFVKIYRNVNEIRFV